MYAIVFESNFQWNWPHVNWGSTSSEICKRVNVALKSLSHVAKYLSNCSEIFKTHYNSIELVLLRTLPIKMELTISPFGIPWQNTTYYKDYVNRPKKQIVNCQPSKQWLITNGLDLPPNKVVWKIMPPQQHTCYLKHPQTTTYREKYWDNQVKHKAGKNLMHEQVEIPLPLNLNSP